jgi:hypothetical protein
VSFDREQFSDERPHPFRKSERIGVLELIPRNENSRKARSELSQPDEEVDYRRLRHDLIDHCDIDRAGVS